MGFLKKLHWFEWFIIVSILGIHAYVALSGAHNFPIRWFTRDDAYYYFKVAQNISEGHGSTFDGINLTNGYHPLWMLVCVPIFALARFDLILPLRVLVMVMAVLDVLTSIFFFRLLRKVFDDWVAILLVGFWTYTINVHSTIFQQGMETGVVVLSTVVLLLAALKFEQTEPRKPLTWREGTLFGLAAAFSLFSRLDMIFLVIFASLYVLLRNQAAFRNLIFLEAIFAYICSFLFLINFTGLNAFMLAFDTSALIFAVIAFFVSLVAGWLLGLYQPPSAGSWPGLILRSAVAAGLGAAIGLGGILVLQFFNPIYNIPKLVPVEYTVAMAAIMVLLRWAGAALDWRASDGSSKDARRDHVPLKEQINANAADLLALLPNWLADALRLGWLSAGSLGLYMVFNHFMFGTSMPVSGQIKRWWGSLGSNVYGGAASSIANIFGVDPSVGEGWLYITVPFERFAKQIAKGLGSQDLTMTVYWILFGLLILAAVILFITLRKKISQTIFSSGFFLLFCASFFTVIFYGASAYSAKHEWYWAPQMLATVMFFGFFAQAIIDGLRRLERLKWIAAVLIPAAIVIYLGMLFYKFNAEMITRMPFIDPDPNDPWVDVLPRIEQNTEPGSLVGMTGGGNVGYFIQDRTIMNMDGLINSYEYFQYLKAANARTFYKKVGLDYVFASKFILVSTAPYSFQFDKKEFKSVKAADNYGNKELLYYRPFP